MLSPCENPSLRQSHDLLSDDLGEKNMTLRSCSFDYFGEKLLLLVKKYFTSCDPHHDIYTFCYWEIFWHSIWHIFWHSIWHIFWHIIYSNLLAFYPANILALYLAYLLTFYLTSYLAFYLAYLLAFYLTVEVQRCTLSWAGPRLRSSGAH